PRMSPPPCATCACPRRVMKRAAALAGLMIALAQPALAQPAKAPPPAPSPGAQPQPQPAVDLAYGAYERGFFLTAFNEATKLAAQNDAAAMTLLGELYSQGLGVPLD